MAPRRLSQSQYWRWRLKGPIRSLCVCDIFSLSFLHMVLLQYELSATRRGGLQILISTAAAPLLKWVYDKLNNGEIWFGKADASHFS